MAATYFWLLGIVQLVLCCFLVFLGSTWCRVTQSKHLKQLSQQTAPKDSSFNILAQIKSVDSLLISDHNSHADFFLT